MGCICSKGKSLDEYLENNNGNRRGKSRKGPKLLGSSSGKEEGESGVDRVGNDANARLISNQNIGFTPISPFDGERKRLFSRRSTKQNLHRGLTIGSQVSGGHAQFRSPGSFLGTPARERVQVVTGWPPWLTAVAREAINGWVPRKADSFEKLDKIGQGTYSSVYRARDLETSKIVALKKVRFTNMDPESVRFMAREIIILRRLDHPNIMKLEGLISSRTSSSLYLVFEYMDHDLAGIASTSGSKLSEAQIKCYMQQLFNGLEYCHSQGVLHRDIKGSNLLIDNNGTLKIGDFGLSTFFGSQQKQPLTSRVVTLWYRPPELLLGATDYGVPVDMWSAGCILAELFARKPIMSGRTEVNFTKAYTHAMSGRTEVEQLHKIFKLCGSPSEEYWKKSKLPNATIFKPQQPYKRCFAGMYKDFPSSTLKLLDTLLAVEPNCCGTASSALQSEFFTTKPLPCDPSSLPKYPPSKELDVKLREEEAKRQEAAGGKGCRHESMSKFSRDFKAVPAPASIKPNPGAAQLARFSNSVAVRGCNNFGDNESSTKQDQRHHLLNGQNASNKNEQLSGKDSTTGYGKMNRVHYSGPLVPPGGNMDEMLKEHEKQIQNAVRKARQAKKT